MAKKAAAKKTTSGGKKWTVKPEIEEVDEDEYLEPEVEAPEEVPEAVPVSPPSEDDEGQEGEPVSSGSSFITITGEGSIPTYAGGAMRRIPCGEKTKVSKAEMEVLKAAGVKFKKG